jgi:CheY-like chemotaxis protein
VSDVPQPASQSSAPLVLVIDDAEDLQVQVADLLESNGFRVTSAKNGFEGVRVAVDSRPDVILMDLAMPGMDGLETARLLKRQAVTAAIPIVAFTGQTVLNDLPRIQACGFAELIMKSHDPLELVATLRRLVNR